MREQLFQKLLEASDRFAGELTELVLARVDQLIAQAESAFEVALSAFAGELSVTDGAARQHDVRDEDGESRSATQPRSQAISPAQDLRSARGSRGDRKNAPLIRTSSAPTVSQGQEPDSERVATNVSSSYRALQQGKDLPPSTSSGRKPNSCRKCGAIGFTSSTCGKTHNVSASPTSSPPPKAPPAPSSSATSPSRSNTPPPPMAARIDSLRSKLRPARAAASDHADGDVPLHKVVSFGF